MITPKHARCCRWCWAYVSRYAYLSERAIAGATLDYRADEVRAALADLEACGYIRRDCQQRGRWVTPFEVVFEERLRQYWERQAKKARTG